MKFREPYQAQGDDPNARKRRIETQLAAWRVPRFEYWAPWPAIPPAGTELTAQELRLWFDILRVAEPVLPRTHRAGFGTYVRLHGLRVEDLERDNAVLFAGDRVALGGKAAGRSPRLHDWSLLVPEQIDGRPTETVLRKRFQDPQAFGDTWLVAGSWFNCTDSISVLVHEALIAATPEALMRLWHVSLALHLEYRFLPALPAGPAKALAELLGAELLAAADHLGVETDAQLLRFAMGPQDGPNVMPLDLPASRFARLLEIERFFEHAHHRPGDTYYDAVASALVRVGDAFGIGNVLLKLQPGSALISALESVALDRPEFIAWYVWHQSFHAEGAFALLQLMQRVQLGQANLVDLNDEWLQVQQLGRELMLLGDQATDWSSLVALGVHDESESIRRRHYGVAPIDREKAPYEGATLWTQAVSATGRGEHYVDALERHFHAAVPHSDASLVFALRLLGPLRESGQWVLAARLAAAIVDAYVAGLSLDIAVHAVPTVLSAYGELLAHLRKALAQNTEAWERFLHPFDTAHYLALALEEQANRTSTTNSPVFTVPRVLRAHAETLVALASSDEGPDEPLLAALALRDADRTVALHVGAFAWMQLARITSFGGTPVGTPLFVAAGRVFANLAVRPPWLDGFLHDESEAHILAAVAAGVGTSHPLRDVIRPKLEASLAALLTDDHGVVLGHALELANLLNQAELPQEAERFARYALTILADRALQNDSFTPVARSLLVGALAQQRRWTEILAFETDGNLLVLSQPARFVENMRALAFMEQGNFTEAEEAIRRVLKVDASNAAALVNLTALRLREKDWLAAIAEAESGKQLLPPGDDRDHLLLNEAHAREKLGDRFGAGKLVDALVGPLKRRPDVIAAREELRLSEAEAGALPLPPTETAARTAVETPPLEALLDAVETATTSTEKGRSLEELMARLFGTVPGFEVTYRDRRTQNEEIDIVLRNGATDPIFSREEAILPVECKNWTAKCGRPEFVLFKAKIENRSGRATVGFLVSWNGFAETVTMEMLRGSRERTLIVPMTGENVRNAIKTGSFAKELERAWHKAVHT